MIKKIPALYQALAGVCLAVVLAISGCGPSGDAPAVRPSATASPRTGQLSPYPSRTATQTLTPTSPATPSPLPSPSPTPRSHVIVKGEDMFGIAWRYGISLEDLMAANPEVNPNLLKVGDRLVIPASDLPLPSSEPPTPTPIPLDADRLQCTSSAEGGAWCFWLVHNQHDFALENVSAVFRLADQQAQNAQSVQAFLPLDLLPPGASMPLVAYFPPPLPLPFQTSAELLTVLPNPANDGRYLAVHLSDQQVMLAENGLSASVAAQVSLDTQQDSARRVWVAAVAYDQEGQVVGVRRWENTAGSMLGGGEQMAVILQIYSLSEPIVRVELFAEARP